MGSLRDHQEALQVLFARAFEGVRMAGFFKDGEEGRDLELAVLLWF